MKTIKTGCALAVCLLAASAFADTYWRWSSDGGATWENESESVFQFPAFASGGTHESNVIEIVMDCTAPTGMEWNQPFTLRSTPDTTRTITFGGSANLKAPLTAKAVVSNIVLSGGCEWTYDFSQKSLLSGLGRVKGNETQLFQLTKATSDLTLGPGCVLTNLFMNCNCWGAISGAAGKITMLDGARIVDCRGCEAVIDICGSGCIFEMKGGEVTRCYNKWNKDGFLAHGVIGDYSSAGTLKFSGGWIHGNCVELGGVVATRLTGTKIHLSGSIRIEDNHVVSGNALGNLSVGTASQIIQDGDFDATARVGVSCEVAATAGEAFGKATSEAWTGAGEAIFCDSQPSTLVGSIDAANSNLVWVVPELKTLVYASNDAVFEGDGATARTIPDIVVSDPSSGATVTYAESQDGTYSATKPTYTAPGLYPIWFKIEADGYFPVNEARLLVINDPAIAATTVRIRNAGNWLEGRFSSYSLPQFFGGTVADNVVEAAADATIYAGTSLLQPFTLRSAAGSVRTLTWAKGTTAEPSYNYISADVVVSNIVLHGGAEWYLPNDLTSDNTTKGTSIVPFIIKNGAELTLGSGGILSNYYGSGAYRGMIQILDGRMTMLEGSRLANTRVNSPIIDLYGNNTSFVMRGGEITRCRSTVWGNCGGLIGGDAKSTTPCSVILAGGRIHGNMVSAYGAITLRHGSGSSVANMTCEISGAMTVQNNTLFDGTPANVYALDAGQIRMTGTLAAGSHVGVTCAAAAASAGTAFGTATSADHRRASGFFPDSDPDGLVGAIDSTSLNLVWMVPTFDTLSYVSSDAVFEGDGSTARSIPDVIVTTPGAEALITYATSKTGEYSATKPTFTAPGVHSIWYKIEADGYFMVNEARILVISDPTVAETTVRIRNAGSGWLEGRVGSFSLPSFAGTNVAENVVELAADCTVKTGTTLYHPFTLRSAAGAVRTLTHEKGDTSINTFSADVVVSNVVLCGGVVWSKPNDLTSDSTSKGTTLIPFKLMDGAALTLGSGTVVSNFTNGGTFRGTIQVVNGRVAMLEGARFVGCRVYSPLINLYGNNTSFTMYGGEITRCRTYRWGNCGGLIGGDANSTTPCSVIFAGGRIHDNICKHSNEGAVNLCHGTSYPDTKNITCEISGVLSVWNNRLWNTETQLNVYALGANQIVQTGDLAGVGRIGVTCAETGSMEQGAVFGTAEGDFRGANFIRSDTARLNGRIEDGNLVWRKLGIAVLVK